MRAIDEEAAKVEEEAQKLLKGFNPTHRTYYRNRKEERSSRKTRKHKQGNTLGVNLTREWKRSPES